MTQKTSKKAQAGTLATLIIVLASAIVIGAFIYKINTELGGCRKNVEACRFSIVSAATSKRFKTGSPINELKCPRGELCDVVLKKDDIVEKGKINQDKAHKIIADAMAECWWMVGEGKIDPFSNWDGKGESYCLVCKNIEFDEELLEFIKDKKSNIESPIPYLNNHKYKKEQTYWNYLYNTDPRFKSSEMTNLVDKTGLSDGSQIIIMMHKYDKKSKFWIVVSTIGGLTLAVTGGILTATGVGAVIGVPLIQLGAGAVIGGGIAAATLYPIAMHAYSECEDCNAVGGVALVPNEQDLTEKFTTEIKGKTKEIPLCSFVVN